MWTASITKARLVQRWLERLSGVQLELVGAVKIGFLPAYGVGTPEEKKVAACLAQFAKAVVGAMNRGSAAMGLLEKTGGRADVAAAVVAQEPEEVGDVTVVVGAVYDGDGEEIGMVTESHGGPEREQVAGAVSPETARAFSDDYEMLGGD